MCSSDLHGVTGYLAPLGDVEKMAEYALDLLRNDDLCQRFCAAARDRAAKLFDYRKLVPRYESVYRDALGV